MMSYTKSGSTSTYKYNSDGIRTTKVSGGVTTKYLLDGSTILLENRGGNILSYYYDANGKRIAFKYNGEMYYYVYNLQGDVTHIMKSDKTIAGTYQYDAWGKILNLNSLTAIAKVNPFRYRGYYYDTESNLYYVGSRYYNPEFCRFINADTTDVLNATPMSLTDKNLYAYCDNNPLARADADGQLWNIVIGAVVGGAISGIVAGISSYKNTGELDWGGIAISTIVGAANGAVAATGLGAFAQAGLSAAISGAGSFATQCYSKGISNVNFVDIAVDAAVGFGSSLIGTGAGKLIGNKFNKSGTALVNKGRDKLLTGVVKQSVGQSHSSLIRQGTKYVTQGMVKINTARGISSVVGSGLGAGTSIVVDKYRLRFFR